MHLIDTHTHITCDRLYARLDKILDNANTHNIQQMMIVCTNFVEFERARALADQDARFQVALGFHPTDLNDISEEDLNRLQSILKDKKVDALGEIGLDYHWGIVDKQRQKDIFIRQIEWANEYGLPLLIHMRDATQDTMDILKEYAQTKFVMHCFSGSVETAQEVMRRGGYLSFAGPITFKNARGLTGIPKVCDVHKIFVESDCPFLTPHPHRGRENEPMYVNDTFAKVCELLEVEGDVLAKIMQENYRTFLHKE